jgi:prepilin-type N-terminal cleavage/methylation domain-containing protein
MPTCNQRRRNGRKGFTLIEFAVVICIIAILATLLLNRIVFYNEQAEKAAMEQTLGTLRSALHLQVGAYLLNGKATQMAQLAEQNPMNWLAEKPSNYAGEFYTPKEGIIATGSWYYDVPTKNLIYLAHHHEYLHASPEGSYRLLFRAKVLRNAELTQGGDKSNDNSIDGVVLEPIMKYQWF